MAQPLQSQALPGPQRQTSVISVTYISTLFVTNIHCSSCISYAEGILRPINGVQKVDGSIANHKIQVQHKGPAGIIAEKLIQAAFKVGHLTTTDTKGRTVIDDDWGAKTNQNRISSRWSPFTSKEQRKHIENCNACKAKMSNKQKRPLAWPLLKRLARINKNEADSKASE